MTENNQARMAVLPLRLIDGNAGQLPGLPTNPRSISAANLDRLKRSLSEHPDFLRYNPLKVVPHEGRYVAVGGNMRLRALREMGAGEAPCVVIDPATPAEELKAYTILDNTDFGEWEWGDLKKDWDRGLLDAWGVDVEGWDKMGWRMRLKEQEKRCDLRAAESMHRMGDRLVTSHYKQSANGLPLSQIKTADHVEMFAERLAGAARGLVGLSRADEWRLLTTPKRRHKGWNFAEEVCKAASASLGVEFISEAITTEDRGRLHPTFTLVRDPGAANIILYDDICTTGQTLGECLRLLAGRNVLTIVGIWNR